MSSEDPHHATTDLINKTFLDPAVGMKGTTKVYDKLAEGYNKIVDSHKYIGPGILVDSLVDLVGDRSRSELNVMDLGCGTGLVGEKLHASGFTNLDGLDPSQGMLDVARSKGVYDKLICAYVGVGEDQSPIEDNSYDVVTMCGSMGMNMTPPEGCLDMQRIVKPGGYVINGIREETVTTIEGFKDTLEPLMAQMEKDGKWKLVSRVIVPNYLVDKPGVIFTHQVC